MQLYLTRLAECQDTSEILELVLTEAIRLDLGIKTIRYYRLRRIKDSEHLVSADCAGHNDYEATQLRLGAIRKVRNPPDKRREDGSFDVIINQRARPVVFQINPTLDAQTAIGNVATAPLAFFEIRGDGCNDWLGDGATRDAWADVPLRLGGRPLGKFSCSLALGRIKAGSTLPTGLAAKLVKFQRIAEMAASFLESLRALDVNTPLEEIGREVFACESYEALYKYCTTQLIQTRPFDYESADFFVVSRDTIKHYAYPAEDREDSGLQIACGTV